MKLSWISDINKKKSNGILPKIIGKNTFIGKQIPILADTRALVASNKKKPSKNMFNDMLDTAVVTSFFVAHRASGDEGSSVSIHLVAR